MTVIKNMAKTLPRALYIIAALSWILLLWPNPVTIFLSACFSCLTIPVYRRLQKNAHIWRRKLQTKKPQRKVDRFLERLCPWMPLCTYTLFIVSCLLLPISALVVLVSPQAAAGLVKLRQLRANNFQIPDAWMEYFHHLREKLAEYPTIEKLVDDSMSNIDNLFSDAVGALVSRGFGFLGGTMTVLWIAFLFLTLTIFFTVYGKLIRRTSSRILSLPNKLLGRFIDAVFRALKAIVLGFALVALVQGFLCGVGFAVAGVSQPAFWGMLATLVAPIPMVGTALVWLPLCISLWFSGNTMAAIGLALWGAFFISAVDNVLRPFFLKQGIRTSFFVLVLAILCGLNMFGGVGLISGPVLLAIALQAFEEANKYYKPAS